MKVSVLQKHIDTGRPMDPCFCVIAEAISDAIGETVTVDTNEVTRFDHPLHKCDILTLPLPEKVSRYIGRFDSGLPVEPMEFEVPGLEQWRDDKPEPSRVPLTSMGEVLGMDHESRWPSVITYQQ